LYFGAQGASDHPLSVFVTSFGDAAAASAAMEDRRTLARTIDKYQPVRDLGDDAFEIRLGPRNEIVVRRGPLVLEILGGSEDFAAPALSALEAAARIAAGRL